MKARAATLYTVGPSQPCADSKPLRSEEMDVDRPGPGEVLERARHRTLPLGPYRTAEMTPGTTAAVAGLGGEGMNSILAAPLSGARDAVVHVHPASGRVVRQVVMP